MSVSIDLEALTKGKVHNLSGHERGLAARELFGMDDLDEMGDPVEIRVPEYVYGISPSFVQGFLSESVKALGSTKDAFANHYHFAATDLIKRQFDRGLSAILTDREFPALQVSSPGEIGSAHVVGWALTSLGIGASLLWNYFNRQHSNTLARTIRQEHFEKEVWDRHRTKIEERLEELTSFVSMMPATVLAAQPQGPDAVNLDLVALTLNHQHDAVARALNETDESAYCRGHKWPVLAYGELHDNETSWDLLLAGLEHASEQPNRPSQIEVLESLKQYSLEIELAIKAEIRDNEHLYRP